MTDATTLFDWREARDAAMQQVAENAGANFARDAMRFVVRYLRAHGEASGETITDACKQAGIRPRNDDRAFGPILATLMRDGGNGRRFSEPASQALGRLVRKTPAIRWLTRTWTAATCTADFARARRQSRAH